MKNYPKISIITPSYNQAQYLEATILSVLGQNYPNLEYIIIDGGSTDGSVEIIKKYAHHLTYWHSQKDEGHHHALNMGFSHATGSICAFLNSDDLYMPNIFHKIAEIFVEKQKLDTPFMLCGNCLHFYEYDLPRAEGSDMVAYHQQFDLTLIDYIIQPATFFTQETLKKAGLFNQKIKYIFDWEWLIRCQKNGVEFMPINDFYALYRFHGNHKTGTGGAKREQEIADLYEEYHSKNLKNAYILLCKKRTTVKRLIKWAGILQLHKIIDVRYIPYKLFFRSQGITFEQFKNIVYM